MPTGKSIHPASVRVTADSVRVRESLGVPFVHFTTRILIRRIRVQRAPHGQGTLTLKTASPSLAESNEESQERPPPTTAKVQGRSPATPAYGHSKDHRNDLKQITLAVACDRNGLIQFGTVMDGNASDKVTNLEVINEILTHFPPELRQSMVYIADSALVMGTFLSQVGMAHPDWEVVMVLDGVSAHLAKRLAMPDNIQLVCLPPYSPELNPTEIPGLVRLFEGPERMRDCRKRRNLVSANLQATRADFRDRPEKSRDRAAKRGLSR